MKIRKNNNILDNGFFLNSPAWTMDKKTNKE